MYECGVRPKTTLDDKTKKFLILTASKIWVNHNIFGDLSQKGFTGIFAGVYPIYW